MLLAKLLLAVCLQVTSDAPVVTFRGELGPGDPVVTTEALARTVAAEFPTRGQTLSFTPESSGPHRVELRSFSFKPYLVVRAPSGAVLGEDEYSLFGILPRVTVELEAGQTYRIDAGSRCGAPGAFTVDVFRGAAPVADQAADRAQALTYAREGLRELESRGTGPDSALGTALHRLAYASLFSGQVAEGIELFRRALAVREDALGAHPLTAETCISLGGVLQQTGDAAGALPLLQRALAIDEQVFGPGHPVTAGAARSLASLYELRGEPQAAEPLYMRALGVLEPALGPDAKDVLFVRSRLALLLHKRGELDGAMALYEGELATRERLNPGRDPESARVLESLAAIHEERGEPQAALGLLERALERREATVGHDHRDTAGTLAHLGVLLKALGETERGAGAIERAVAIDPDVYVPELVRQADEAHWWNDRTTRWWQLVWVGIGALLFAWSRRRASAGLAAPKPWLALAVLVSALTYVNFGAFQFGSFVHRWDSFHYYVGAKYFDELRYDGLYDCVVIADQETPGWSGRNASRVVRDLRTNQIVDAASVLAAPEPWKSRFTPERWSAFCADVASFRDRESAERWEQTTTDHGYNATPVWGILGGLLANVVPATDGGLVLLAALDQVYLAALVVALVWGFGWELAALAMVVFATFYPGRFAWTGGSLLRWDWLFFTVLAVAALRKQRPWLAGLALGYATLLRVFPVFVFAGPVLAWLAEFVAARREGRAPSHGLWPRFFGGALVSVVVLVPISFVTSGGVSAWSQFATNSAKHQETPLTNYMGLRTVLTWRADSPARTEESRDDQTFWDAWRTSRTRAWGEMRVVHLALVGAWLVLLALAVRGREPWLAAALSVTLIPVAVELTCYYLAFVVALVPVAERRPRAGYLLLALSASSLFVSLAPLGSMTTWEDQQFTQLSVLTLIAFALVLFAFRRRDRDAPTIAR